MLEAHRSRFSAVGRISSSSGFVRPNCLTVFLAVVASGHQEPFRYFNSSPEMIRLVVMMYVRYPLSLRNVEDLLAERGIDISHETVRFWWNQFGPDVRCRDSSATRRAHARLSAVALALGRGVCEDQRQTLLPLASGRSRRRGVILEAVVTAKRDKDAALKLLKRIMKEYGRPRTIVTDGLRTYPAAMKEIGNADRHEVGRRLNNRAENSHRPFRRRERVMQLFGSAKTFQKFSSIHAQVHNHFNQERHLVTRQVYKQRRSAALVEWRALIA